MAELLVVSNSVTGEEQLDLDLRASLVEKLHISNVVQISWREANGSIARLNEARAVITGGVDPRNPERYPAEMVKERLPFMCWMQQVTSPMFGICIGLQFRGVLAGAEMQKGVEIETGLCDFEALDSEHCLFEGLGKTFPVRSHHWASLTSVPEGFTHLGRTLPGPNSTGCEVAMMESTDGRIVSTQFHPELIDTGLVIMENFLRPRHQP